MEPDEVPKFVVPLTPLPSCAPKSLLDVGHPTQGGNLSSSTPVRSDVDHCGASHGPLIFQSPLSPGEICAGNITLSSKPLPMIDLDSKDLVCKKQKPDQSLLNVTECSMDSLESGYHSISHEYPSLSYADDTSIQDVTDGCPIIRINSEKLLSCDIEPVNSNVSESVLHCSELRDISQSVTSSAEDSDVVYQPVLSEIKSDLCSIVTIKEQHSPVKATSESVDKNLPTSPTKRLEAVIDIHCLGRKEHLIGKNIGVRQLDIVSGLLKKDMYICVTCILNSLTGRDLVSFSHVCRAWRSAIESKKIGRVRKIRQAYIQSCRKEKLRLGKENPRQEYKSAPSSARPALGVIPNQQDADTETKPAGYSPTKLMTRYEQYVHYAKELVNEETLDKCPKCEGPAKVNPTERRGICCKKSCSATFCVRCRCDYHGGEACYPTSPSKLGPGIGTKKAKKNLKRLL